MLRAQLPGDTASTVALARIRRSPKRVATKALVASGLVTAGLPAWLISGNAMWLAASALIGATVAFAVAIELIAIVVSVRCPCCDARVSRNADRCAKCSAQLR